MPLTRTGKLARAISRANTPEVRARALARAVKTAKRKGNATRAEAFIRTIVLPDVVNAARAEWDARAAQLPAFDDWLAALDTWLLAHRYVLGRIPAALYPSRMRQEAWNWSRGNKGRSPDELRSAFVTIQARAIAVTPDATLPTPAVIWNEVALAWGGISNDKADPGESTEFAPGDTSWPINGGEYGVLSVRLQLASPSMVQVGSPPAWEWEWWTPGAIIVETVTDVSGPTWGTIWTPDTFPNPATDPNPWASYIVEPTLYSGQLYPALETAKFRLRFAHASGNVLAPSDLTIFRRFPGYF